MSLWKGKKRQPGRPMYVVVRRDGFNKAKEVREFYELTEVEDFLENVNLAEQIDVYEVLSPAMMRLRQWKAPGANLPWIYEKRQANWPSPN